MLAAYGGYTPSTYAVLDVPPECAHIVFDGEPIIGTDGDDVLVGTDGNDLIFGLDGNDTLDGSFNHGPGDGDDCLVGGSGYDYLRGWHGDDVLLGGAGRDWLEGGYRDDILWGGDGKDALHGGEDENQLDIDKCWGEAFVYGNDYVSGGTSDEISCELWWEE